MKRPTIGQRISYDLGRELPEELHEWVIHDLVGHGAEIVGDPLANRGAFHIFRLCL